MNITVRPWQPKNYMVIITKTHIFKVLYKKDLCISGKMLAQCGITGWAQNRGAA